MKNILIITVAFFTSIPAFPQRVNDFQLLDVISGKEFSLSQHKSATAIVLIFTTNTCPFSKLYEQRIMDLVHQFSNNNIYFALINPHAGAMEGESTAEMVENAKTKMSGISYLPDPDQELTQALDITKIPEAVVITNGPTGFGIVYKGAIDNNPQLPQSATRKYLEDALFYVSEKKVVSPASTRPAGCNVRAIN